MHFVIFYWILTNQFVGFLAFDIVLILFIKFNGLIMSMLQFRSKIGVHARTLVYLQLHQPIGLLLASIPVQCITKLMDERILCLITIFNSSM